MKTILFGICLGFVAYAFGGTFNERWLEAQREATKAYPDLGKAGSPLNKKFVELYQRATTEKSFIMTQPDWPSILAEQAAAELSGQKYVPVPSLVRVRENASAKQQKSKFPKIRLKPMPFHVPSADLPPIAEGPENDPPPSSPHKVTLPVQIFPDGFAVAPISTDQIGPDPWLSIGKLLHALKRRDEQAIKLLLAQGTEQTLQSDAFRTGRQPIHSCSVVMIAEIEGVLLFFWRDRTVLQPPLPLILEQNEYRISDSRNFSKENQRLVRDLFWFLMVNPPKALIAKER